MEDKEQMVRVGTYLPQFNELTGQALPCGDILRSSGLLVHLRKHHPDEMQNLSYIPEIIAAPDYIGHHPKEPDSIELVKVIEKNIMVCVKLDKKDGYLYVASVFSISDGKLQNRLNSGRLKKYV